MPGSVRERLIAFGLVLGFLSVLVVMVGIVLASLDDTNMRDFGRWLDENGSTIWKTLVAAATSAATYLLGRRAGRRVGKTEAYSSTAAISAAKPTGNEAAEAIRADARNHGLRVDR